MVAAGAAFIVVGIVVFIFVFDGFEVTYKEEDGGTEVFFVNLSLPLNVFYAMAFIMGSAFIYLGFKTGKVANNAQAALNFYNPHDLSSNLG